MSVEGVGTSFRSALQEFAECTAKIDTPSDVLIGGFKHIQEWLLRFTGGRETKYRPVCI